MTESALKPHRIIICSLIVFSILSSIHLQAEPTATKPASKNGLCPNAEIWGTHIVDHICWSCLLPIHMMGIATGNHTPPGANKKPFCSCTVGDEIKSTEVGISIGFWEPHRMIEVVRTPYCTPSMGGQILKNALMMGHAKAAPHRDLRGKVFYHYHWFSFPLLQMLELMTGKCSDDRPNMDLMYLSELDPTWNDDRLAFFTNPEVALFANPVMQSACIADCVADTLGHPIQKMHWCAGCWGSLYPFSGHIADTRSPPRESSLILTRALAALHRRGLAKRHVGRDNMCQGSFFPMLPKADYKISQLYPMPEAKPPCCHSIGANTFKWGEWRNIPAIGEDFVYLLWRYTDCCLR